MTRESIWQLLGLEKTRDVAAIKRAYAQRLKDTRPDDNPEGFQRLRGAYERALALSEGGDEPPLVTVGDLRPAPQSQARIVIRFDAGALPRVISYRNQERGSPQPQEPPEDTHTPGAHAPAYLPDEEEDAKREDERPAGPEALPSCLLALRLSLAPHSGAREEELLTILSGIVALLPSGSLMQQRDAEWELACLLKDTAPASDFLLEPAIKALGWQSYEKALEPEALMQSLLERWHQVTLERLASGKDPDSQAYTRLRRRSPAWRRSFRPTHTEGMSEMRLLNRLRSDHPGLMRELDAQEVAWWDRWAGKSSAAGQGRLLSPWFFWLMLASALLKLVVALVGHR